MEYKDIQTASVENADRRADFYDAQRSTEDIVLEESDIWEVENKIRIPYNGKLWEYNLTTLIRITPPLQDKGKPTLEILGSFKRREPTPALEKIILDCKNPNG